MLRRDIPSSTNWLALQTIIDQEQDYTIRRYRSALWYLEQGIHVLPFRQGSKAGYPKGIGLQTVSTVNKIESWWNPEKGNFLDYDIALPMGGTSGLCAIDLDVDEAEDKNGIETLAELLQSVGGWGGKDPEIDTWIQETPRGGRHIVYKFHPEINNQAGEAYKDIDTRGGALDDPTLNAGVIFAAPTIKRDKNGVEIGTYKWQTEGNELSDVPSWLVDCLKGRISQRIQIPDAFLAGSRDNDIHKYLMSCAGAGYTEDELRACVPEIIKRMVPADEKLVDKNLNSVLKSRVFKSATKEKKDKDLIGGLDLDVNKKTGIPFKTEKNLHTILSSAFFEMEMGIYYDAFLRELTYKNSVNSNGVDVSVPVKEWLSRMFGVEWGAENIISALLYIYKSQKEHTNILKDYIYNCPYNPDFDTVHMLGDMMGFKGMELEQVYRRYLKLWLAGAVARALNPGTKFDYTLILIGAQGVGKSMLLAELSPNADWFCDSLTSEVARGGNKKDELQKLQGAWVVEMAELTPFKQRNGMSSDAELKGFLTATSDKYRAPYERLPALHQRTCVFAGTSNSKDLFRDASGNRRYLTIDIGNHQIEWSIIKEIRDSLWGQVREYYIKEGHQALWLDQKERVVQEQVNRTAHHVSDLGEAIWEYCKDKTRVHSDDIALAMLTIPSANGEKANTILREARERLTYEGWARKGGVYIDRTGAKKVCKTWHNPNHPWEMMTHEEKSLHPLTRLGESVEGSENNGDSY